MHKSAMRLVRLDQKSYVSHYFIILSVRHISELADIVHFKYARAY